MSKMGNKQQKDMSALAFPLKKGGKKPSKDVSKVRGKKKS